MKSNYFKVRRSFDFSPHPYDIGNAFGPWKRTADSHFLLKIYQLDEGEYGEYYNYHLRYTLDNHIASEEEFFRQVWQLVYDRIRYFRNKNPFNSNRQQHLDNIDKLQQFQKILEGIDKWNARPSHLVITEKELLIQQLKEENEKLKQQLAQLNQYEVKQKISIEDEHLPTLIDVFQQMRNLKLPSDRLLLRCDFRATYAKLIAKYFSHGEKDIPVETARNYFVEKSGDVPSKGTEIDPSMKIFEIRPKK
ncbi:hypothetical protein [Pedobacter nanyangensis]|uniref:hypothetical protein n=1 Tax=Pedobacter nanyangensis TaxID=1562389 RepID=UPI000DE3AA90|nr:hypothetical protein [Pedobacter nanyangensis]